MFVGKTLALARDQHAEVIEKAQALFARADKENRDLNEAEEKQLAEFKRERVRLEAAIERGEIEKEHIRNSPRIHDGNQAAERRARGHADSAEWDSLGELLGAVADHAITGQRDQRLFFAGSPTGHGERNNAEGGFLVGKQFEPALLDGIYSLSRVAPLCRTTEIGPGANGLTQVHIDETSRANGSRYGSVLAYWKGEADTFDASKIKFRETQMQLEKLTALLYASDELLEDATALTSIMNTAVTQELAFRADDAVIRGTGAGMPLGILNSGALVTVSKESGQAAATINAENVKKMYARMWPSSLSRAVWLCNQDCLPQLWSIRDQGTYVSQMMPTLREAPPFTIMGRPVLPIEQCATIGTVGDLILFDGGQYQLIQKGRMQSDSSIHVRYLQQETAFRFILRVNGQPLRKSALTPYQGTNTVSPFVVLETR